jgi:hypothetical protein
MQTCPGPQAVPSLHVVGWQVPWAHNWPLLHVLLAQAEPTQAPARHTSPLAQTTPAQAASTHLP